MQLLVVNTKRQYEEKELATVRCPICGVIGMAFTSHDTISDPHYCNRCKPKEVDE